MTERRSDPAGGKSRPLGFAHARQIRLRFINLRPERNFHMPVSKKRFVAAEDLYSLQQLSDARISPDGRNVIYRLQRVDRKTEKKLGNLWIVPTGNGEPRQFTYGDQSDSAPRWSQIGRAHV